MPAVIKVTARPPFRDIKGRFAKATRDLEENKRNMMRGLGRRYVVLERDEAPEKTGKFMPTYVTDLDFETGQGKRAVVHYTVGAQAVDLEVDTETGQIEIRKIASAYDVGKAINPDLIMTQIEGGAVHGLSSAFEAIQLDEKGQPLNSSFVDYRIASIADIPQEIHGDIVETPLDDGPWGARGVGEHVMVQTAPAIANAIHDALGIRFTDLPLSAEKIFMTLQKQ